MALVATKVLTSISCANKLWSGSSIGPIPGVAFDAFNQDLEMVSGPILIENLICAYIHMFVYLS